MHHRALGHFTPHPAAVISQWTFAGAPSFAQALQAAASRAWMRRDVSHSKGFLSTGNRWKLPSSSHIQNYGSSNPNCDFSPDMFAKRGFATSIRPQDPVVRPMALTKEIERKPSTSVFPVPTYTPVTRSGDASLSTPLKPSQKALSPSHDVDGTIMSSVDPSETLQPATAIDEYHSPRAQSTHTRKASTATALPPPRTKPTPPIQAPISSLLGTPTSRKTLSHNLRLALTLKPIPTLPALIDYHDAFPKFRSTNSYNFLIELAIRHTQFGCAHWLLDAMIQDELPRNTTTRKLTVRLLVRSGKWEMAWKLATGLNPDDVLKNPLQDGLPPPTVQISSILWMELLGTVKRGAIRRHRDDPCGMDETGNRIHLPIYEVVKEPTPGSVTHSRRRQLLACVRPVLGKREKRVRPYLIKAVVALTLRDGHKSAAVALTKSYLSELPPNLNGGALTQYMDIIHSLLSADLNNGLKSFYANRKLLISLLKIYPSLKPSSTTLSLILSPLKKSLKSGTIAISVVKMFRKLWGNGVVDDRVRRRVAKLAEKEGRIDVVEEMTKGRSWERQKRRHWAVPAPSLPVRISDGPRILRRPRDRKLFRRKGRENVLMTRLRGRIDYKRRRSRRLS